jgi:hypothetical protein
MKCPEHVVDYETVKTSYDQLGVILKDVKALRCPVDGEELFSLEQVEAIRQRIALLNPKGEAHTQNHQSRRKTINIPPTRDRQRSQPENWARGRSVPCRQEENNHRSSQMKFHRQREGGIRKGDELLLIRKGQKDSSREASKNRQGSRE